MSALEVMRHLSVFSPHAFGNKRVDVVGAGATGSRIVFSLAKLGVANIHVWDFDKVEEHNIPNQVFSLSDIGKFKGEALKEIVAAATGTNIIFHNERVDGSQKLGEIVFILTDTMKSRSEIWQGAIKFKLNVNLLVETRMGADSGRIYSLHPSKPAQVRAYEETLYSDEETEVSACGASTSVGPTAEIVSGLAVWQMIRWFSILNGADDVLDNEIIFSVRPMLIMSRVF